jgi:hypothetical protein
MLACGVHPVGSYRAGRILLFGHGSGSGKFCFWTDSMRFFLRGWKRRSSQGAGLGFFEWLKLGALAWLTLAPMSRPRRVLRQIIVYARVSIAKLMRALGIDGWLRSHVPPMVLSSPNSHHAASARGGFSSAHQQPQHLSPRARQIYHELQAAIEKKHKGRG